MGSAESSWTFLLQGPAWPREAPQNPLQETSEALGARGILLIAALGAALADQTKEIVQR